LFFWTNDVNANYNALLTELQHHFSNTFEVDAQYTYGKAMDNGSFDYNIGDYPLTAGWNMARLTTTLHTISSSGACGRRGFSGTPTIGRKRWLEVGPSPASGMRTPAFLGHRSTTSRF